MIIPIDAKLQKKIYIKWFKETFGGGVYISYLDCSGSFTGICMSNYQIVDIKGKQFLYVHYTSIKIFVFVNITPSDSECIFTYYCPHPSLAKNLMY